MVLRNIWLLRLSWLRLFKHYEYIGRNRPMYSVLEGSSCMILFEEDWAKYPTAIIDTETKK